MRENEKIALYVWKSENYLFFFTFSNWWPNLFQRVGVCVELLLCHRNPVVLLSDQIRFADIHVFLFVLFYEGLDVYLSMYVC